jgi:hypothetical protein
MNVLPDTQRHLLLFKSSMTFQIEGNDLYLKFLENEQAGSKGKRLWIGESTSNSWLD